MGDADRCVSGGTSLCPILEIRDGVLHSALAACTMTDPVPLPEIGAVMLTLTCDAAPVTWDQRALFQIDDTGRLTIVRRTGTRQYLPLSPEAPPPLFPLR
ncbi:MAG: hypothetical protein KDK12_13240 [Rhodobacteraceae bacterium]|nr:hypothetical protein [Paracoccaceae bacterium]